MLKILFVRERFAPVFICDICGSRIVDASEGFSAFISDARGHADDELLSCYHVHKDACALIFESKYGPPLAVGCSELSQHIIQLAHNLGMGIAEIDQALAAFKDFGSME